jgi:hypothetical protein
MECLPAVVAALTTTTAAGSPVGFGPRFINRNGSSVQFMAAQGIDCTQSFRVAAHLDKSESSGLPRIPVSYDADTIDGSVLLK